MATDRCRGAAGERTTAGPRTEPKNPVLRAYDRLKGLPGGRWLFTWVVCWRSPYFYSVRPRFSELSHGRGEVRAKKRRRVENHIGTFHAIAMCNLAELVAGVTCEVTLPQSQRWIPRGMNVDYLSRALTDVRAVATVTPTGRPEPHEMTVPVDIFGANDQKVVHADIRMWITPKRKGDA